MKAFAIVLVLFLQQVVCAEEAELEQLKQALTSQDLESRINACNAATKLGEQAKPLAGALLNVLYELYAYTKYLQEPENGRELNLIEVLQKLERLGKAVRQALKNLGPIEEELEPAMLKNLHELNSPNIEEILNALKPPKIKK